MYMYVRNIGLVSSGQSKRSQLNRGGGGKKPASSRFINAPHAVKSRCLPAPLLQGFLPLTSPKSPKIQPNTMKNLDLCPQVFF